MANKEPQLTAAALSRKSLKPRDGIFAYIIDIEELIQEIIPGHKGKQGNTENSRFTVWHNNIPEDPEWLLLSTTVASSSSRVS